MKLNGPAQNLEEVYLTLDPKPLETPEELRVFYKPEINQVRGGDKVQRLKLGLKRAHGGAFYKALFTGHQGVGKSTELSRLIQEIEPLYRAIRFSATADLDPVNFKPLDVFLLMMAEIAEKTALPVEEGGAGREPSPQRLRDIQNWFAQDKHLFEQTTSISGGLETGGGMDGESPWAKVLGLFAKIKGEIRYASNRKDEVVEYRIKRLDSLIHVINDLIDECNQHLKEATGREWLFIA